MLWHLALALRTVGVLQLLNSRGLQLQLGHVGVDHHELLLVEKVCGREDAAGRRRPPARQSTAQGCAPRPVEIRKPRILRRKERAGAYPCGISKSCYAHGLQLDCG